MLFQNGAIPVLHFLDPGKGVPSSLKSLGRPKKKANRDLIPCDMDVDCSLAGVFGIDLDVGHHRKVWANGKRTPTTDIATYGRRSARVIYLRPDGV